MISAEELSLEIRESDDSLHNIFLKNGLSLAAAFKLLEKRKGKTAPNGSKDYVYLKRRVYVVKKNDVDYGQYQTLEEAQSIVKELKKYDSNELYVIGGGSIYEMLIPYCDTAYITKIDHVYAADTYFPNLDQMDDWEMTEVSEEQTCFDLEYVFAKYERK